MVLVRTDAGARPPDAKMEKTIRLAARRGALRGRRPTVARRRAAARRQAAQGCAQCRRQVSNPLADGAADQSAASEDEFEAMTARRTGTSHL